MQTLYAKTNAELLDDVIYTAVWCVIAAERVAPTHWIAVIESVHTYKGKIIWPDRGNNHTFEEHILGDSYAKWVRRYLEADPEDANRPARRLTRAVAFNRIRMLDLYCKIIRIKYARKIPSPCAQFSSIHL